MQFLVVFAAVAAVASAGFIPAATIRRAPAFDSAVIKSDRLGGNFAYSTAENHAYAVDTPIVQNVATPVAVSYSAPALTYAAAPALSYAAAPALSYAAAPALAYSGAHIAAPALAYSAGAHHIAAPYAANYGWAGYGHGAVVAL